VLAACLAAAMAGFIIGVPTLRLKGDYLAIATLGFGEIIRVVLQNINYVGGPSGIMGIEKYTTWAWLFGSVLVTLVVIINLVNSSYGRAIISIREDEVAAELMGINTTRYKVLAFVIGAMFAGLAGALYAHYFYIIKPDTFNFLKSFDILVMVVLGGLGSTTGAVIAAIFITTLTAVLQSFPAIRMILYALILIIVMIYRPQGLMGNKEMGRKTLSRIWGGKE
jgi:branched-chain amino acid transport system permease protein